MDGLLEELLRLESAKYKALIEIDASAYEASVHAQLRLLSSSRNIRVEAFSVDRLQALSELITLNTRLLQNLVSSTPAFNQNRYTAEVFITATTDGGAYRCG